MSRLKEFVRENETQLAAEQLAAFLRGANLDLYNEVLLQTSRLNRLRKQERTGLLTPAEAEAQKNRVNYALLELIDAIPEQLHRVAASPGLTAGSFPVPSSQGLEQIFGSNHLKSIAWLHSGIETAKSVCRIVTPNSRGTGFLVGHNLLLTNHHVIPDRPSANEGWVEFNYEEDTQQRLQPSYRYKLKPSTLIADAGLDFCLVEVEEGDSAVPPLKSWGNLELDTSAQPRIGDHVTIIQHPQGGPKQIALTANQVVSVDEHRLQYSTDTLPGSSGSPVFNDAWKVIALHHAGGQLISNARGDRMFANEGILVSYLAPWLKR